MFSNTTFTHRRFRTLSLSAVAVLAGSTMVVGATGTAQAVSARPAAASSTPMAYVANESGQTISEIDTATDAVTGTVSTRAKGMYSDPQTGYTSPDGKTVWVQNEGAGNITVIDAKTHKAVAVVHICTVAEMYPLVFTPDGSHVYVVCVGNSVGFSGLFDIDTATKKVTQVGLSKPLNIAVSPDGTKLYVTGDKSVMVLDTATDKITATIPLPGIVTRQNYAAALVVSKDGSHVYVGMHTGIGIVDTATNTATTIPITDGADHLMLTADGSEVLSTAPHSKNLTVTSTATNSVTARIGLGSVNPPQVAVSPTDSSTAYVEVQKTGTKNPYRIDAVDLATGKVTEADALNSQSDFISFSPDGSTVYASPNAIGTLVAIDAATAKVTKQIALPVHGAGDVVFAEQGAEAFVSLANEELVLDTSDYKQIAFIAAAQQPPYHLVATPNGQTVYSTGATEVVALDTATNTTSRIALPGAAGSLAMSPDGSTLYVSDGQKDAIYAISTATGKIVKTFTVSYGGTAAGFSSGDRAMAFSPDGTKLYVTGASSVSIVDPTTGTVSSSITVAGVPNRIAVSPDGGLVYTSLTAGKVAEINTATNAVSSVTVGGSPTGVAFTPDGSKAYVSNWYNSAVYVIDTATGALAGTISTGTDYPEGVAFTPDGTKAYVTEGSGTVSVISTATATITGTITVGANPTGVTIVP